MKTEGSGVRSTVRRRSSPNAETVKAAMVRDLTRVFCKMMQLTRILGYFRGCATYDNNWNYQRFYRL